MSTEDEKLLKEAKKLPWDERLLHKNWKVRNDANIDLAALCDSITDPKDPRLRDLGPLFKKTVADSNAPVQEKALDALIAFLRAADSDAARFAKEVCDAIIAKCLTGRPKTVEKAQAVFLLWVELEAVDAFLETMEKAIKNKVAKAVVPAIDVMFQALSDFGSKVVPPKKILKMLPELFDHQDQNVRASSKGLTLELCRWIGKDAVKSILFDKMRDTMKKELEAELSNVTGIAKPTRKIRSEQDKEIEEETIAETSVAGPSEESVAEETVVDEYDLVDPVDILGPLEKSGFWDGVKATKWSERRDAVAELTKLAATKKIAAGDFSEVARTLKKLVTDINIAVSAEAVLAVGNLARGLRNHFSGSARFLLPTLLEKLKEKKQVLSEALTQTLQAMHKAGCFTLADVIEDIKVAVKNKVPLVRSLSLNWVTFCIESSNKAGVLKFYKEYVPICMECLNDGAPEVRDAAFAALAAIAAVVGMKPLERSLEKLDDVRKKKLSEMMGTSGGGQAVLSTKTGGPVASNEATMASLSRKSAASMLSGKKPAQIVLNNKKSGAAKTNPTKKTEGAGQSKAPSAEFEDVEPSEMSLEEIESRVGSIIPPETISLLKSGVWKERLEAMGLLKQSIEALGEIDQSAELLIRLVCAIPGWAEKNVQVQQQMIEVITYIASAVKRFPKRCVVLCLLGISERVADIKTRNQAMKCLTSFSEAVGPGFVFERMYKIMKEHKNPKVLSEGILWMVSAVEDFGISHVKLKDLIDFCKETGLQSSAAASRNSTIKLIGLLHKFVGPDIKNFLSDVKPALLSTLDAEYEKNPYEGAAAPPKKTVKGSDSVSPSTAGGLDGLPREDISGKITPTLIKNLGSSDWKVRLESIESVNKILEDANKRIQPNGTTELFSALRARLYDSNKNLVMATLTTLGCVASAMGMAVEKASKGIQSDILKCLSDNKKQMRECTLNALDSWVSAVQLDRMIPYITTSLVEGKLSAEGRKDLFDWLSKHLSGPVDPSEALHLLKPTAASLADKSVEVRKSAEVAFSEVLRICGQEMVTKNIKDLRGPGLSLVVERFKLSGFSQDGLESVRSSSGLASKAHTKTGKAGSVGGLERGSKIGSRRAIPTRVSKSDSVTSVQDIALQSQALFNLKDSFKEDRERLVIRRFKFEEPRPEQIQDLEYDMAKYFREDLYRRLLSADFKKQIDGLEILQKALPSNSKEVIEIVDIILRWSVLRFCESNTTCLLKVLEFLPELLHVLKGEGYALTEPEAAIFLPCLIEKSGHNIEKLREKIRELTKQIVLVYPSSKLFPYAVEGLKSKNNRTRIESVELVGFLIDHHGTEISGQFKSLQLVAALTAERDGELRKAALNALTTAYKILGDDIWRYVGKLSDAQKSMMDDRFKWKAREMDKRREGKPGDARVALRRSIRDNGLDVAEQSGELFPRPVMPSALPSGRDVGFGERETDQPLMSRSLAAVNGPLDWREALDLISSGSPEQSVEGMKVVCHELTQTVSDPDNSIWDDLLKEADKLVSCLANMVPKTFGFILAGASSRSCKYVLNTLMQTFQIKRLAHAVRERTLDNLITELLMWLLDERVPLMDDGSQLLKALNVLMLKILDNAERTSSFVVLISRLRPLDLSRWPSPPSNENITTRNQKFSELVVKCLIKLTKVLQSTIFEVDLDRILQSIHVYLQDLGMEEIRRRAGADDKPLRMVKTVLHELVKIRGTAIKGHLSMVPIDTEPQPIILAYIDLNLQTLAAAKMLTPSMSMGQSHWGDSGSNSPAPNTHSADAQLKQELAAVFKKIGDKQTSSIGLYELYRITQLYPKVDIFSQLQNASEAFRTYIREGLVQMEKNSAAGRTPTSLPLSTPPPLSLTVPPSAAPLSPGHSKFQSSKTYGEDNHSTVESEEPVSSHLKLQQGEEHNDRNIPPVTPGTLDAIRERMRSIQEAAAAESMENLNRPLLYVNGSGFSGRQQVGSRSDGELPVVLPMDEKALSGLQARMERLKSGTIEPPL
ncbi:ARM repeat superfamily protein [Wolffia australiana]